ncbi:right-handed parallel beta-helix repeat-containing protein [bacterium]|nr:right-handed parallel beta-helix repeat-containing protein [bacterium]
MKNILFLLGLFISVSAQAATFYAAPHGLPANPGISPLNPTTIDQAILNAASGDTIQMAAGLYQNVDIHVDKSLNFVGKGMGSTILTSTVSYLFSIYDPTRQNQLNVNVSDLTFLGDHRQNNCVYAPGATSVNLAYTIRFGRVEFSDCVKGIFTTGIASLTVEDSKFYNNIDSIYSTSGGNLTVNGSDFYAINTNRITAYEPLDGTHFEINNNTVQPLTGSVSTLFELIGAIGVDTYHSVVMNNNDIDQAQGIRIIASDQHVDVEFKNNIIKNYAGIGMRYGAYIYSLGEVTIEGNEIFDFDMGIGIGRANKTKVVNNLVYNNLGVGFEIRGDDVAHDNVLVAYNTAVNNAVGNYVVVDSWSSAKIVNNISVGSPVGYSCSRFLWPIAPRASLETVDFGNNVSFQDATPMDTSLCRHINVLGPSLFVDPLFVSSTDFHLQAGSPLIDQGRGFFISRDFDGYRRLPQMNDIGAFEFH